MGKVIPFPVKQQTKNTSSNVEFDNSLFWKLVNKYLCDGELNDEDSESLIYMYIIAVINPDYHDDALELMYKSPELAFTLLTTYINQLIATNNSIKQYNVNLFSTAVDMLYEVCKKGNVTNFDNIKLPENLDNVSAQDEIKLKSAMFDDLSYNVLQRVHKDLNLGGDIVE